MKLNGVLVGFTKSDGEEHLLLRERNYYIDLLTKEVFKRNDIDINSLIPFKDIVDVKRDKLSKRKVVKLYKLDREKLISLFNLHYCDLILKSGNKSQVISRNKLLEKGLYLSNSLIVDRLKDLKSNILYKLDCYVTNGVCVKIDRDVKIMEDTIFTKKKILEMNYRREL